MNIRISGIVPISFTSFLPILSYLADIKIRRPLCQIALGIISILLLGCCTSNVIKTTQSTNTPQGELVIMMTTRLDLQLLFEDVPVKESSDYLLSSATGLATKKTHSASLILLCESEKCQRSDITLTCQLIIARSNPKKNRHAVIFLCQKLVFFSCSYFLVIFAKLFCKKQT